MSSTAQRAVAARMAARVERRGVDLFDAEAFGPGPSDGPPANVHYVVDISLRQPGELCRIWRWVRREYWTAQVVLALMAVAVAYIALVFGLLVGAGIGAWLGG
jgi:hypothetical protein